MCMHVLGAVNHELICRLFVAVNDVATFVSVLPK